MPYPGITGATEHAGVGLGVGGAVQTTGGSVGGGVGGAVQTTGGWVQTGGGGVQIDAAEAADTTNKAMNSLNIFVFPCSEN